MLLPLLTNPSNQRNPEEHMATCGTTSKEFQPMQAEELKWRQEEFNDVVIFVHGTWGRGIFFRRAQARWCESDAPLCAAISRAFPAPPKFVAFPWSGRNNIATRARVAKELRSLIESIRSMYGDPRIHLITHSHGGNIACYALRKAETRLAVASLVCLSTPFLLVTPRLSSGKVVVLLRSGLAFLMFVLIFWAIVEVHFVMTAEKISGLTAALSSAVLAYFLGRWLGYKQQAQAVKITKALELPKGSTTLCPTLIVRAPSDEASIVLATAQLISNILTMLAKTLGFLVPTSLRSLQSQLKERRRIEILARSLIPIAALCTSAWEVIGPSIWLADDGWNFIARFLAGTALYMLLYWAVPVIAISAMIGMAALTMNVMLLPFGSGLAVQAWGLHVSAEASPPGEWQVVQLEASDEEHLSHATHSNPQAIGVLEEWLRTRFRRHGTASVPIASEPPRL